MIRMHWLAFALAYAAVVAFALAMAAHHRTVFARRPDARRQLSLRFLGGALLALSAFAALRAFGPQIGLVAWIAMLATSSFVLTQFLAFAPRLLPLPGGLLLAVLLLQRSFG